MEYDSDLSRQHTPTSKSTLKRVQQEKRTSLRKERIPTPKKTSTVSSVTLINTPLSYFFSSSKKTLQKSTDIRTLNPSDYEHCIQMKGFELNKILPPKSLSKFRRTNKIPPTIKYKTLGTGTYGHVLEACKDECLYAVKAVLLPTKQSQLSFGREYAISKLMSDAQVGAKLHAYVICETTSGKVGIMIFEKMPRTLDSYFINEYTYVKIKSLVTRMRVANIAHLDLKPDNIAYTASGELRIIDWGLAVKIGIDVPFLDFKNSGLKSEEIINYYKKLYGVCVTDEIQTLIHTNYNKRTKWNPSVIDDAFMCKILPQSMKQFQPQEEKKSYLEMITDSFNTWFDNLDK